MAFIEEEFSKSTVVAKLQISWIMVLQAFTNNMQWKTSKRDQSKTKLFNKFSWKYINNVTCRLFATSRTRPVITWPCLTNSGFSRRQRTWYQCVSGSVGLVLNHIVCCDPAKATSNQNARPWQVPDSSKWNSNGISGVSAVAERNTVHYYLPIVCKSVSSASRKSTMCRTDLLIQIRMSNVSTIGCLKYSFSAQAWIVDKLTPWKHDWYLQKELLSYRKNSII